MKNLGTRLSLIVVRVLVAEMVLLALNNKSNGKTIFGNEPKPRKTTRVWKGYIQLGTDDYKIEECMT